MNKLSFVIIALAFSILGGCANMAGSLVGTSAVEDNYYPSYIPASQNDSLDQ